MIAMKNNTLDRLVSLKSRMLAAYDAGDWQYLADLDRECQQTVTAIISDDPRAMFSELRDVMGFYAELVEKCKEQRGVYASEVIRLRRSNERQNVYNKLLKLSVVGN